MLSTVEYIHCWNHPGRTNTEKIPNQYNSRFWILDQNSPTFYNVVQASWRIFWCEQPIHYEKTNTYMGSLMYRYYYAITYNSIAAWSGWTVYCMLQTLMWNI